MKIRGYDKEAEEVKLEMTPMIDIVFQLLVFFIMTYKVTAMEGDYNIRMPAAASEPTLTEETLEDVLMVRLVADPGNRYLQSINVTFGSQTESWPREQFPATVEDYDNKTSPARTIFRNLNNFVIGALGSGSGDPASASEVEAEIEADYGLRYEETVYVIEAISGYKTDDGKIVKLIEKIKFRDAVE